MRNTIVAGLILLIALPSAILFSQDKAQVQMEKPGAVQPGKPIAFNVKLNEPLPKGAYFQVRVSPVAVDQQLQFASGEPLDESRKTFRVSGLLPEGAVPGKWHISVIYLFLAGSGWTNNTIKANELTFEVEGKPFPIPNQAEISLVR